MQRSSKRSGKQRAKTNDNDRFLDWDQDHRTSASATSSAQARADSLPSSTQNAALWSENSQAEYTDQWPPNDGRAFREALLPPNVQASQNDYEKQSKDYLEFLYSIGLPASAQPSPQAYLSESERRAAILAQLKHDQMSAENALLMWDANHDYSSGAESSRRESDRGASSYAESSRSGARQHGNEIMHDASAGHRSGGQASEQARQYGGRPRGNRLERLDVAQRNLQERLRRRHQQSQLAEEEAEEDHDMVYDGVLDDY